MEGGDRNRRYLLAFLVLVTLTALEMNVIRFDAARAARITALVGLAMAKAAALLLIFMNLGSESRAARLLAAVPLVLAPGVAIVVMLDAVYRVTGGR